MVSFYSNESTWTSTISQYNSQHASFTKHRHPTYSTVISANGIPGAAAPGNRYTSQNTLLGRRLPSIPSEDALDPYESTTRDTTASTDSPKYFVLDKDCADADMV